MTGDTFNSMWKMILCADVTAAYLLDVLFLMHQKMVF
jgi:hypothetical protein